MRNGNYANFLVGAFRLVVKIEILASVFDLGNAPDMSSMNKPNDTRNQYLAISVVVLEEVCQYTGLNYTVIIVEYFATELIRIICHDARY